MQEVLVRAGSFLFIICLGHCLRRFHVLEEDAFRVLSKIAIRITLPATVIVSFSGKEMDPALLSLALIGLGGGVLYSGIGLLINRKKSREQQAFEMLNTSGYNIGNFTMPFVQSFLGPVGVITTSLFDTGNSFVCLGGAFSVASMVKDGGGFSVKRIVKALVKSVPFDCYVIMTTLCLLHISLPAPVVSFAEIVANANAFAAMFMLGIGFKLSGDRKQIGSIVRILTVRYSVAIGLACVFFFCLPFSLEIRQALMILVFAPIASAVPAFTEELKLDVGLSSAVNSISIVISIVFIVSILLITL